MGSFFFMSAHVEISFFNFIYNLFTSRDYMEHTQHIIKSHSNAFLMSIMSMHRVYK